MANTTKSKVIRKEFRATVRATFPKHEADAIIAEAEKNGFDEDFCFKIYEEAIRPM